MPRAEVPRQVTVVEDPAAAARLVAAGDDVVLVVASAAHPDLAWPVGPGRIALFVGDPSDPAVMEAAGAMGTELWAAPRRPQNSTSTR